MNLMFPDIVTEEHGEDIQCCEQDSIPIKRYKNICMRNVYTAKLGC